MLIITKNAQYSQLNCSRQVITLSFQSLALNKSSKIISCQFKKLKYTVFLFTYFYTAVTFDPEALSENLQKNGAFIPGIRPGASTSSYISNVLNRITLLGAVFLGFIAVLPLIMQFITGETSFALGGTSVLIVVSVVLDLIKKVDAQVSMREY